MSSLPILPSLPLSRMEEVKVFSEWKMTESGTCTYYYNGSNTSPHIMCTDWIDTLIEAKSGDSTPRKIDDWVFTFDSVPLLLRHLNETGWQIVIFSNYSHLHDLEANAKLFQQRAELMFSKLGFRPSMFISMKKDKYSKPAATMWNLFRSLYTGSVLPTSFYCGDKSGNLALEPARTHDSTDLDFAHNIGLTYYDYQEIFPANPLPQLNGNREVIILVGIQGAGKSTVVAQLQKLHPGSYEVIERKKGKHEKQIDKALAAGRSIIFDAINGTIESRAPIIAQARKYGFAPIILWLARSGRDRNKYRTDKPAVPQIALTKFINTFEEPLVSEGAIVYRIN